MTVRDLRLVVAAALVAGAACSSGPGPIDSGPYVEQVRKARADKDAMLRTDKDSPIPAATRASFPGLAYYDINPQYRIPAELVTEGRGSQPQIIELPQTDGKTERMRKVGALRFTVNAVKYTLTAFSGVDDPTMERLFVPFGDLTNGSETYQGGRFLNLDRTATGLYDLDFNQSYHPYCVYNPEWICPVPPRENRLPVAIPAGERLQTPVSRQAK